MIIVTGGTGQLGSQIVDRLLDFTDPRSLAEAFEGATQVLIISTNLTGEAAVTRHIAAIDAAHGARRILYTSHQGAAEDSVFAPMPDHAATEQYLSKTGTPFTALRNGFYANTVQHFLGQALETGELVAPADGPVSWTAHADLAEAAAIILADEGRSDGPTPPLTAPDALDLADIAGIATDLTGRTIRRVIADDADWTATMISHGVPADRANILLGMFQAARRGEFATTGPELENLLQRPATPVRSVVEELLPQETM
jgi:NAD(P)H dehydrogenase (quinone)